MESLRHSKIYKPVVISMLAMLFVGNSVSAQPNGDLNIRPDNPGTGAYPALKEADPSLPDQVVYRPGDLDALGDLKLGVVAWGNGGCSFDGASSRFHLLEIASHGYLVIAGGNILSGPGAPARAPVAEGEQPPRTSYTSLSAAIDWALAENARPDSKYYGRIDAQQVALSGFSCGGVQANQVAGDPRVKTLVMHNTGIFNEAPPVQIPDMAIGKDALADIHTPLIYILGGESDIAYGNGMDDYQRITHVPVAVANIDKGHGGTFSDDNGGSAAQVAVNWLNWQLRGDREAALYFIGADCGLCRDPQWILERKFHGVVAP
jgi:hypothetical protein